MSRSLSVILICKNEASCIRETLEAVRFADELIVVDSGSTDGTIEIVRDIADRVIVTDDWPGFGPQKNRALEQATCEWVLSIDADETVRSDLRAEIEAVLAHPKYDAYRIPRLTTFLGREIRHSGWWPDYVLRLFRRGSAVFSDSLVHERVLYDGRIGTLKHPLRHQGPSSEEAMRQKSLVYADAAAHELHRRGRRSGVLIAAAKSAAAFLRDYVFRLGVLDGYPGWVIAKTAATGKWRRYMRLNELNRA